MRVLYTHDIFSSQTYGGISRYFVELIRHMPSSVDARVFSGLHVNAYLAEIGSIGLKVPCIPHTGKIRQRCNAVAQVGILSLGGYQVIHQTYYGPLFTPRKVRRVLTVYDMIHEVYPDVFPASDTTSAWKRGSCNEADHILAISQSTKRDLIEYFGIESEKISVTHLASNLKPSSTVARLQTGRPYILHVGGRNSYKNFRMLLESYAASTKINNEFDLVCFGPAWAKNEVEDIGRLGMSERVHRLSGGDSLLASYYQGARLLVYPSVYEGFGLPPLEAMQLGCPVLCTSLSSIPEVVGNAGEYFDPQQNASLQHCLENLAFDDYRLARLSQLGTDRASAFSWSRCAEQTLSVYSA